MKQSTVMAKLYAMRLEFPQAVSVLDRSNTAGKIDTSI